MAQRVRGYTRQDGTKVRSYTRSGPTAAVAAAALVFGGAAAGVGTGSGAGGATARPGSGSQTVQARAGRTTDAMLRLERKGYRVTRRTSVDGADCENHAYGQVVSFFRRNPCAGLVRMSFEVRDRRRNVVLVAVASVAMPDEGDARRFRTLVDRHGTGNLVELSRERGRYRSVRFTGFPYASRRDGPVVTNVQVQPVGRGPGRTVLELVRATALE